MDKEELLRDVFAVDTEAGYNLRRLITKAEACKSYARNIFYTGMDRLPNDPSEALSGTFLWIFADEGEGYWYRICQLLRGGKS